ncbi:hypothetical protein Pla144_36240 [Bythopirellula polymerisocia]|uniref:HNH endonuclease n=1 Tax=Bythopirellula polymerisocia TaxID=2528003 RepID=A0A5C6CJV4_9BACT|nr:hypothetical protein Pla144_36240 [Bythopirellula polymerisocia]
MKTKICDWCGQEKPRSEFAKMHPSPDGRRSQCRDCRKLMRRQGAEFMREYKKLPSDEGEPWQG